MEQYIETIVTDCSRIVISKPADKKDEYRKIVIYKKPQFFQIEKYTTQQVFHENVDAMTLTMRLTEWMKNRFRQLNAFEEGYEHMLLVSKKGVPSYKKKHIEAVVKQVAEHNRKKNYILEEGEIIPPLVDMGIFTAEGRIVRTMNDKFRQINRFLELIDDYVKDYKKDELHIIDFGCGKSYLTFIMYYYFTEIRKQKVQIVGLDLKKDVIAKCNEAAEKYGYSGLHFELGDINGYHADFPVDMVVTLHACDTATDFALYNAISWNAQMIFSVPCCQHELNGQMETEDLSILTRYGIIKERFAALTTDAIRANLLECCGYKSQLLEFVDLSNTPKNLLIRARKRPNISKEHKRQMLTEVRAAMEQFSVKPMLYGLLEVDDRLQL